MTRADACRGTGASCRRRGLGVQPHASKRATCSTTTTASRIARHGDRVQGPLADAALEMRARTPSSEFSFTPRIRATYFPDEQDLDTIDYFAFARLATPRPAHQHAAVAASSRNRTWSTASSPTRKFRLTRTWAMPDFGDSGRVLVENRRTRASLRPIVRVRALAAARDSSSAPTSPMSASTSEIPGAQVDYPDCGRCPPGW